MGAKRTLFLIAPAVLVIGIFMLIPMFIAMGYSFMTANPYGGVNLPLTFDAYVQFLFQRDFDDTLVFAPDYIFIILRSIYLAVATTLICLVLGLPVAWYIVCQNESRRRILLFLITLPFWINTLIRTYCWILILRDEGLINDGLRAVGITSAPLPLLYNDGSILLGLVYTFLPFMVLPIYSTLERIDFRLIEAAYDLYADRIAVFKRVVWPLAKPGALAGVGLVFAPALGSFLAPDLLGGGKKLLIGSLIQMQFSSSRNWPFGAALSTVIAIAVLLVFALRARRVPPQGSHA
ncbi:ABC transporter permease [Hypericibacter terrae]|jgi:spermidine/putrescine transport system permease protein|uniref:ABC transporter permease n=1 Tax=Hypericibacter terrae TaxID=2602015 RepID=A0A5J6MMN9_9PROT|nr:ABC transporter permease [Hypericibacter terrae]QEX18427.1 ABC transporter permease [Hypericibacter terrae]